MLKTQICVTRPQCVKTSIYLQVTALLDKVKLLLINTHCIIGLDFILVLTLPSQTNIFGGTVYVAQCGHSTFTP